MEGLSRSLLLFLLLCLVNTAHANTPPSIDVTTYTICVDIPAGEYAFTIAASDPENDPLTFTLTGINAENFTLEENIGVVRVRRPLDRQDDMVQIGAVVSDGFNTVTQDLFIILTHTNSYAPQFEEASYYYNFPENTAVGSSLFTVKATDEDPGFAGAVKYSIDEVVPSSGSGLFTIDESSGEVRLTGGLNFTHLSQSYQLKINASDGGGKCHFPETTYFSSVAVANITVEDVPDLDPEFTGLLPYIVNIYEHCQVGAPVFLVTARDPDTGVNAEITFSIEDSTVDGLFQISSEGFISVQSDIDREALATDTVILTVKATESVLNTDGVYASTTTSVVINIIDINDNPPRFYMCGSTCVEESHYTVEVLENSLGSIPINMTVKDLDKDTKTELTLGGAGKDVFGVEPQFTVSEQAVQLVVIQSQKLDYEKIQLMIIEVIATDRDNESLQSTATVTVHIKDANDNKPKFPEPSYRFHVSKNSPIGTVVAQITATDADKPDTANSQIVYGIETSRYSDLFTIDPDTGVLKSSGELDSEALDGRIELKVTATDKGLPPLSSTVPVIISILTVDKVNEVHLEFSSSVEEVEENLDDIIRVLRAATNASIEIVSITPATSRTGAIIIARFVNSEGTTLTADEVKEMISDPEYSSELEELGLIDVGDGSSEPPDQTLAIVLGVLGVVAVVIIVVVGVFIKKKKDEEKQSPGQRNHSNRSREFITTF